MPKAIREAIDDLNAVITIQVSKEDYQTEYTNGLKKMRKESSMKGFRQGKAPMSFVTKMHGKQILTNTILDMLNKELSAYLDENGKGLLGEPLFQEGLAMDFNPKQLEDYEFKFDIGVSPEFEVAGWEKGTTISDYIIKVKKEAVDEEIDRLRLRNGEREYPEDGIEEKDVVSLIGKELEKEGGAVKVGGVDTTFSIAVDLIANADFKKALMASKVGDKLECNVFDLEEGKDEAYTKKFILKIDENAEVGTHFEVVLDEITRVKKSELNEDFFKMMFPEDDLKTEKEFRAKIEASISDYQQIRVKGFTVRKMREALLEANPISLPDAFLKRWLVNSNEELTAEKLEEDYDAVNEDMRWQLIREKIIEILDVKIEEEELVNSVKTDIARAYGLNPDLPQMKPLMDQLMKDSKFMNNKAITMLEEKILEAARGVLTFKEEKVSEEEFSKLMEETYNKPVSA